MCYLSAIYRYQISSISLVIVEFQRCPGLLRVTRSTADSSKNMPTTVSLQPKKKKEKRLIQHAVLVVSMRLLIRQSSLCDPVTWFYACRNCALNVASTNASEAFIEVQLVVNVGGVLRPQR